MFLEEPRDVVRATGKFSLLLQMGGDLLEAQRGIFDVLDQYPDGGLCAQGVRRVGPLKKQSLLALLAVELGLFAQITKLAGDFHSIQLLGLVQASEHGVARVLQFLGDLAGGQSGGTAPDQVIKGGEEVAVFGKANALIVPKSVPVELRSVPERVPLAIIGVAPEITDLLEETTNRDESIAKLPRQWD